jgi:hypothetical protein
MGPIEFINNTLKSLNSKDEGFSWRKLGSTVVLSLVVYLHMKYANAANVLSFLLYDFGFIAVLLGLLNLDRFIQAKFGNGTSTTPDLSSESKPIENQGN